MRKVFTDDFLKDFWKTSDYATKNYISAPPDDESIASVEKELGYELPASYIELMRSQNGGFPKRDAFPTAEPTSWAKDHVALTGIFGIGREKSCSLGGEIGSQFMIDEWGLSGNRRIFCRLPVRRTRYDLSRLPEKRQERRTASRSCRSGRRLQNHVFGG